MSTRRRLFATLVVLSLGVVARAEPGEMSLWRHRPAEAWTEALPVGNGRLGAMTFGKTDVQRIQFDDHTLWVGGPRDYSHPGAAEHLPQPAPRFFVTTRPVFLAAAGRPAILGHMLG